jgi:hypothetical protein
MRQLFIFIDIGGNDDHHSLNCLFIKNYVP